MTQVLFRRADRAILAFGAFPDHDPADPDTGVADVADPSPLAQPGTKALAGDGTIVVTPPPGPTQADLDAAQQAAQIFANDKATLKAFQTLAAPTAVDIVKAIRAQTRMLARLALVDN